MPTVPVHFYELGGYRNAICQQSEAQERRSLAYQGTLTTDIHVSNRTPSILHARYIYCKTCYLGTHRHRTDCYACTTNVVDRMVLFFFLNLRLQCSKSGTVEYLVEKELDMRGAESLTGHKDSSQIRRHYFTQHVSDTTSRSGNMLTINEIRDAILTCAQKLV